MELVHSTPIASPTSLCRSAFRRRATAVIHQGLTVDEDDDERLIQGLVSSHRLRCASGATHPHASDILLLPPDERAVRTRLLAHVATTQAGIVVVSDLAQLCGFEVDLTESVVVMSVTPRVDLPRRAGDAERAGGAQPLTGCGRPMLRVVR